MPATPSDWRSAARYRPRLLARHHRELAGHLAAVRLHLHWQVERAAVDQVTVELAEWLELDNPAFNREQFFRLARYGFGANQQGVPCPTTSATSSAT